MPAKPSIYIESTIVSYLTSRLRKETAIRLRQETTRRWWKDRLSAFSPYVSEAVLAEIELGDPEASKRRLEVLKGVPLLPTVPEVERVAGLYLKHTLIPENAVRDALHIAFASIHGMDYLITWNLKHIARGEIMRNVLEINQRLGIKYPIICTPNELMEK